MTILHSAIVVAMLLIGGPEVSLLVDGAVVTDQGFIARAWTWSDEHGTTTFTAYGPADQVYGLDPQQDPLACVNCQLVSSTRVEPGVGVSLTAVAEETGPRLGGGLE